MGVWQNWNGDEVVRAVEAAVLLAQNDTGEVILGAAKQEVPLDESTLQKSGTIVRVEDEGATVIVVSFGGGHGTGFPIVPYAVRWHETQANFQHGRKWKYVRDPFNRLVVTTYERALRQRLGAVL
ncbi:MAG: hypothetical protein ABF289_18250 [Clostridiales bacterium]